MYAAENLETEHRNAGFTGRLGLSTLQPDWSHPAPWEPSTGHVCLWHMKSLHCTVTNAKPSHTLLRYHIEQKVACCAPT